jgi:hypothetical protein
MVEAMQLIAPPFMPDTGIGIRASTNHAIAVNASIPPRRSSSGAKEVAPAGQHELEKSLARSSRRQALDCSRLSPHT